MPGKSGRIITFYSYKGGTGRTMAVSNIAWIMASNGYDVLLVDWDLEAPGLHRYLRPFLIDPELSSTPGLIDFVWDAAQVSMTPLGKEGLSTPMDFPSMEDYVVGLDWNFVDGASLQKKGSISFIPAGRQDENYAQRVNTFNWDNFYERLGGGKLLHAEREALRQKYDYILIDSRTGVSDTSSICTVQMPDVLAVFFTLNRQNIKGAAAIAASVTAAVKAQRGQTIPIFPIPTRVENAEEDKKIAAIKYARRVFAPLLIHVQSNRTKIVPEEQLRYWNDVETPYRSFFAFEEVPAAFKEEAGSRGGLLAANERIASWITDQEVRALQPVSEARRNMVVANYAFTENEDWNSGRIPPPKTFDQIRIIWDRVRWQVKQHFWRYASILALMVGLSGMVVDFQARIRVLEANELAKAVQLELSRANSVVTTIKLVLPDATSQLQDIINDLEKDQSNAALVRRLRLVQGSLQRLESEVK